MILLTARLVLRPSAASDVDACAAMRAKPEMVATPAGGAAAARASADAEQLVSVWTGARPGAAPWAVEARDTGRLPGRLGRRPLPEPGAGRSPFTGWTAGFGAGGSPPGAAPRLCARPSGRSGRGG